MDKEIQYQMVNDSTSAIENHLYKIQEEVKFLKATIAEKDAKIAALIEEKTILENKRHRLNQLDRLPHRLTSLKDTLNTLFEDGYFEVLNDDVTN